MDLLNSDNLILENALSNTSKVTGSDTRSSLDKYKHNSNNKKTRGSSPGVSPLLSLAAPCKASKDSRFVLSAVEKENGLYPHRFTFCKSYQCEYCGPKKIFLVRKAIGLAIDKFGLKVFATLTLDPKQCSAEDSAKYIRKVWNKFRIIQKRKFVCFLTRKCQSNKRKYEYEYSIHNFTFLFNDFSGTTNQFDQKYNFPRKNQNFQMKKIAVALKALLYTYNSLVNQLQLQLDSNEKQSLA